MPDDPGNLFALLRSRFPADPGAVFLELEGAPPHTYQGLDAETGRLRSWLGSLGVRAGDRVVVQVEKSPAAVALYLACLRAGAVYVPINTAYTAEEVSYFLADAEPRVFVCDPERRADLEGAARSARVTHVETMDADGDGSLEASRELEADLRVEDRRPDDAAAILYTSGTTGRSKGAVLSHENLASNALALHACWRFVPGDVLLHALPIFHAHGLFVALHCALLNGSRVIFLPRFDAAQVAALLPRASVYMGVPTHYVRLLEQPSLDRDACRDVRVFISGSAPLAAKTHRDFEERTGQRILERYGMTESGMITSNPYEVEGRVGGTVGFPLPGVEARVADDAGRELRRGETGVLEIRGPNVFPGYWRMPEKTREEFRDDGFFVTGDLATMAPDGRVTLVGREKDLVISGGFNVYPAEVEAAIDALAGVVECAVIGVPHPDFGEGVTAVVVRDGAGEVSEERIAAGLRDRLARFKHPKRVFFVDALPRNAMGKVQKNALRVRYAGVYDSSETGEPAGPATPTRPTRGT